MTNFLFTIQYDGTRYHGWERKPDTDTIQGRLENVLARMTDAPVQLIGAGRTDAGVHALAMTANAHLNTSLSVEKIREYMNRYLPDDICVLSVRTVPERFHARFHATGKTYTYTCYCGDARPVFDRKYAYSLPIPLDLDAMRLAASQLVGKHDFRSFTNLHSDKSTVRTVDSIRIEQENDRLRLVFHGDGFLMNMVRILTGTLLQVGAGRMDANSMQGILSAKKRTAAGPAAPARGLCLTAVDYDPERFL